MGRPEFFLQVEVVSKGCEVPVGMKIRSLGGRAGIGRDQAMLMCLNDPSVSSEHAELSAFEGGFRIRNLSRNGTTCVNEQRLATDERIEVHSENLWLQIGRVLIKVAVAPQTLPVDMVIPVPSRGGVDGESALFTLRQVYGRWEIHCRGHRVHLYPSALRALVILCQSVGEVVPHDELAAAADSEYADKQGGTTVPQLITFIRGMFEECLEARWITDEIVREFAEECGVALPENASRRQLLRGIMENIRGVGYRLKLPPSAIRWDR